jgi:hypothetical protein
LVRLSIELYDKMAMIDSQRHDRKVCAMLAAFFGCLYSAFASLALLFSLLLCKPLTLDRPVRLFGDSLDCCFSLFWLVFLSLTPILELCLPLYWASGPFFFSPCLSNGDMIVYDFSL